ncbi:hypothetical protein SAMN05444411_102201 [Lutibacter oricola]|uniref:LTXXQ motif family protein n=1 Tax=Lutibacter oricola TaxID=762486 RepID=A0A1H2WHC3_9FLAO|nr:hypothetical protein [Lutibacter oricola]SDW80000.1 hypothetical protein SAMN05444411_102201 [Lutibacter oricola]
MKKALLILIVFITSISVTTAQKMSRERIKLLKTSYITDAIDLTSNEAEKFWPVYNKYNTKIQTIKYNLENGSLKGVRGAGNNGIDDLSEAEASKIIEARLSKEIEISKQKTEMIKELRKIISAKKILKLHKAERDFNRRLLREFGKRKRMNGK